MRSQSNTHRIFAGNDDINSGSSATPIITKPQSLLLSPDESERLSASAGKFLKKELQRLLWSGEAMIPVDGYPGSTEVHDIRVSMKKGRAILKLLRPLPDNRFYRRENDALRYISSLFSMSREADVLNKTVKMLAKRHPEVVTPTIIEAMKEAASQTFVENIDGKDKYTLAAEARDHLRRAWYRTAFAGMSFITRDTLQDGLFASFSRAEGAFIAARTTPGQAEVHEFRKRSKDLLYQVRFFSDYNPGHFESVYSLLENICSLLGKYNDLSVAESLACQIDIGSARVKVHGLTDVIREDQREILERVYPTATQFFRVFYSGE
jgi:CHAD domain-containing protein